MGLLVKVQLSLEVLFSFRCNRSRFRSIILERSSEIISLHVVSSYIGQWTNLGQLV